jgi:Cys-tRNA(Pro)/Cys-tRNA(Cys) deacylase
VLTKTNSMRLLESRQVAYEVFTFSPDIRSAEEVAQVLGVPGSHVYKTLVVVREKGKPILVMIAGDRELDLKLLARSLSEKKLRMATHKEAELLTGLQVGGISALPLLGRGFDVCIDRAALALDRIYVSAGQRGIDLCLATSDLIRVTNARVVEATRHGDAC